MLAYVFWHRPSDSDSGSVEAYEQAELHFQRSMTRSPPVGMRGCAAFRLDGAPWLGGGGPAYEDWYLVEDYAALGVLGEAAVGRGHRTAHDAVARRYGEGAAGVYALAEGDARASLTSAIAQAAWVSVATGARRPLLGEMLGDGIDPRSSALWRRELVLGPAPEYCVLATEPPRGIAASRLPAGWSATHVRRELLGA